MKLLFCMLVACAIIGCAQSYQGSFDDCITDSCISHKETERFCEKLQIEGSFCIEYNFFDHCVIVGANGQKIGTPCLDSLIYKEIINVFDGKWVEGTVGNCWPTHDSTGAGPYWINDIGYGYSSFTRDVVKGDVIYHHYCKSLNSRNCDLIFSIHTDYGPIYLYNYETKEIKSVGWPI